MSKAKSPSATLTSSVSGAGPKIASSLAAVSSAEGDKAQWIAIRKSVTEERARAINPAENLGGAFLTNALNLDQRKLIDRHLALKADLVGNLEGLLQQAGERAAKSTYEFQEKVIPQVLLEGVISDYRAELNVAFEESLKSRSFDELSFSRTKSANKYQVKTNQEGGQLEIDCGYYYDLQRDFPSFLDELPKTKPFIGFAQITGEPSDELVRGFATNTIQGWYLRGDDRPKSLDELHTQNKKAYFFINEAAHWLSVEIIFKKNEVEVNYCNPSGGKQSGCSDSAASFIKKIAGCLQNAVREKVIETVEANILGGFSATISIHRIIENIDVPEAPNVKIREKHLLEQATATGCGPTAKANLALLMGDKVRIGKVEILQSDISQQGMMLLPEDELRLRLQDYYEILKFDDAVKDERCGVASANVELLEGLAVIKEYQPSIEEQRYQENLLEDEFYGELTRPLAVGEIASGALKLAAGIVDYQQIEAVNKLPQADKANTPLWLKRSRPDRFKNDEFIGEDVQAYYQYLFTTKYPQAGDFAYYGAVGIVQGARDLLADRMAEAIGDKKWGFYSYSTGGHWVLTVVSPDKQVTYLNSIGRGKIEMNQVIQADINHAFKLAGQQQYGKTHSYGLNTQVGVQCGLHSVLAAEEILKAVVASPDFSMAEVLRKCQDLKDPLHKEPSEQEILTVRWNASSEQFKNQREDAYQRLIATKESLLGKDAFFLKSLQDSELGFLYGSGNLATSEVAGILEVEFTEKGKQTAREIRELKEARERDRIKGQMELSGGESKASGPEKEEKGVSNLDRMVSAYFKEVAILTRKSVLTSADDVARSEEILNLSSLYRLDEEGQFLERINEEKTKEAISEELKKLEEERAADSKNLEALRANLEKARGFLEGAASSTNIGLMEKDAIVTETLGIYREVPDKEYLLMMILEQYEYSQHEIGLQIINQILEQGSFSYSGLTADLGEDSEDSYGIDEDGDGYSSEDSDDEDDEELDPVKEFGTIDIISATAIGTESMGDDFPDPLLRDDPGVDHAKLTKESENVGNGGDEGFNPAVEETPDLDSETKIEGMKVKSSGEITLDLKDSETGKDAPLVIGRNTNEFIKHVDWEEMPFEPEAMSKAGKNQILILNQEFRKELIDYYRKEGNYKVERGAEAKKIGKKALEVLNIYRAVPNTSIALRSASRVVVGDRSKSR